MGARLSPNVRGALWMLASGVTFTIMTALVKYLGDYPAPLQLFYRQVFGFLVILPFIVRRRSAAFATTRPGSILFRALAATMALTLAFYGFQKLPLAQANALSFTRPLWLVPLAILVLGEKVGPLRIGATVVGFLGVLLVLAPGLSGGLHLGLPALAMLASALLTAMVIASAKIMTRDHSPNVMLVWSVIAGLVLSIPGAILVWRWPAPGDLALLCAMGVLATISQAFTNYAIAAGDAAVIGPVDYFRLILAAAAGYLMFREIPSPWTWAGAAVVVGSTLFITFREHAARKAQA